MKNIVFDKPLHVISLTALVRAYKLLAFLLLSCYHYYTIYYERIQENG